MSPFPHSQLSNSQPSFQRNNTNAATRTLTLTHTAAPPLPAPPRRAPPLPPRRKKFNGEDIDTISPTLGFNIKTLEFKGYVCATHRLGNPETLASPALR